jgi:putative SOS response-associated peptidase YedK
MCGRFAQVFQTQDLEQIERVLNQSLGIDQHLIELFAENYKPSYNIAPTQHATLLETQSTQRIKPTQAHFGLLPSWSKDRSKAGSMINARSETISEKPAFRNIYRSRRAVLPISGFYEWQPIPTQKTKQPWFIHRADQNPLLLACVCDTWLDQAHGDTPIDSFSIITTRANESLSEIHHRMPVVLEPESLAIWFDREVQPADIRPLLASAPDGTLDRYRVSTRVNSPKNNDYSLIEPDSDAGPATLWG